MDAPPKEQPPEAKKQADLGSARQQQEKVHAALGELLKYLEEHATLQQIKGELRAILQTQKDHLEEVNKLNKIVEEHRYDINSLNQPPNQSGHAQDGRVATAFGQRAEKLLDDMEAMSDKLEGKDVGLHEMLQHAIDIGGEGDLAAAMFSAGEQLADDFDNFKAGSKGKKPNPSGSAAGHGIRGGPARKDARRPGSSPCRRARTADHQSEEVGKNLDDLGNASTS